ncbi:hypothetical protein GCM10022297_00180 [Lactobacillus hamsteri]
MSKACKISISVKIGIKQEKTGICPSFLVLTVICIEKSLRKFKVMACDLYYKAKILMFLACF